MFDSHIAKIEKTGDNINVYMAQRAQLPNQSWAVALAPFPSHICDELGIKNAILVNLACTDAVSWMLDMTKHFLQSVYLGIFLLMMQILANVNGSQVWDVNLAKSSLNPRT